MDVQEITAMAPGTVVVSSTCRVPTAIVSRPSSARSLKATSRYPLAGLNWVALYKWPGEIKDGNGRRQIVIAECADEAQQTALDDHLGRGMRAIEQSFAVFASTILGMLRDNIALARPSGSFEFTYAELGWCTTSVTSDMGMAFEIHGHILYSPLHQGGLIRERSRLIAWLGA